MIQALRIFSKKYILPICCTLAGLFAAGASYGDVGHDDILAFYISPNGNDTCLGSMSEPLRNIQRAQELAIPYFGKKEIHFVFMDGVHRLDTTVVINSKQSGSEAFPVVYRAQNKGKAILCGSDTLSLNWQPYNDSIFVAEVRDSIPAIDQFYVNGRPATMARYPNAVGKPILGSWVLADEAETDSLLDVFNPLRVASWENPAGACVHAMYSQMWGDIHWKVNGRVDNELTYEGKEYSRLTSILHPVYRYIENVFEELDVPGEWFYNAEERRIYYFPRQGEELQKSTFEYVRWPELFRISGFSSVPVSHIHFNGLVFRHTSRTCLELQESLLRSDLSVCRKAAVRLEGTKQCKIEFCDFGDLGGNAISVNRYNRELLIYGCHIHDIGANGITFIGSSSAVRNPLTAYDLPDYDTMDRTPGPKNNIYPANCRVEDCNIVRTGRVEKSSSPILVSMSYAITVNHCTIHDVPRAGITFSDGTFGGHVVEYCDIYNTVQETSELGSFSAWGRDRYWSPLGDETAMAVKNDSLLPTLDMLGPNILRNNRWSCDRGFAINLDEGASNYEIYNNILLKGGLKLHSGFHRTVTNNIFVDGTLHPQLWYAESGDIFKHNILSKPYVPKAMEVHIADSVRWGQEIDFNLFAQSDTTVLQSVGHQCDVHSVVGDPLFDDAPNGNYRVSPESPAIKLGFHNFNLRSFGASW